MSETETNRSPHPSPPSVSLPMSDSSAFFSSRFRAERESEWIEFEKLLKRLERGSVRTLDSADLLRLPILYRTVLSSLSVARATNLDQALLDYLESLARRGYFHLYGVGDKRSTAIARFFAHDWRVAVRGLWRESLIAAAILCLGMATSWTMVANQPEWFYKFVSEDMASGRDPSASVESLRATIGHGAAQVSEEMSGFFSAFAAFLFTHNSMVAILAFSLGFAFGVPTLILLYYNGLILGAMLAVFANKGLTVDFVGWLSIHGTTELFAIVLAGAAGLRIGSAALYPGQRSRLESATRAGRTAGTAMLGVLIMLLVAGLLEGFARQLIVDTSARYAMGGLFLLLWLGYYYLPTAKDRLAPPLESN